MDNISSKSVFNSVKKRVFNRIDSLRNLRVLNSSISFEGWLKVEAIGALGYKIAKVQNRGPDIRLKDGTIIELKASMDKLHKGFFFKKENKYANPVLFIAGGDKQRLEEYAKKYQLQIIGQCTIGNRLIMGMVKPETSTEVSAAGGASSSRP